MSISLTHFPMINFVTAFVRSAVGESPGLKDREEEAMKSFARLSAVSLLDLLLLSMCCVIESKRFEVMNWCFSLQLLNLCESAEWSLYMNELQAPGPKKYPQLPPQMVYDLLFK